MNLLEQDYPNTLALGNTELERDDVAEKELKKIK